MRMRAIQVSSNVALNLRRLPRPEFCWLATHVAGRSSECRMAENHERCSSHD